MACRLDVAGRRNRTTREADLAAVLDADATLKDFASFVGGCAFSTNVSADKVIAFDDAREILDARRIWIRKAGGRAAGLRAFAAERWTPFRDAFEAHWQHGRRLVYGALNGGNMGTEGRYGAFCLVVADPSAAAPAALAVFPADSAQSYVDARATLDRHAVQADATRWSERAALALVVRGAEAQAADERDWPDVLCRPDHYLEVVVAPLALDSVGEVRLRVADRDALEELEDRHVAAEALSEVERNQVAAAGCLHRWEQDGIRVSAY